MAETRALIAGVWQFQSKSVPPLVGPANDVSAMEQVMRGMKGVTDVTVLRNAEVTRTRFETALHAMGLRARPGDWLFIYYSGHGSTADAAVKGTADGDVDQFLPLGAFNPADPETYIVDKDLYTWVSRYVPPTVRVFLVIDSCHSGTMHRSVDLSRAQFRAREADFRGDYGDFKLTARPAPRFPSVLPGASDAPPAGTLARPEIANEIYFGGAQDEELALEQPLPGPNAPSRGLLTYALEHGLTELGPDGKTRLADLNHDGTVTVGELYQYAKAQVIGQTEGQQNPSGHFSTAADSLALFEAAAPPSKPETGPALPLVYAIGGQGEVTGAGFRVVTSAAGADFVWDRSRGTIVSRMGDVVAEGVHSNVALSGVVEKWAALAAIRPYLTDGVAKLTIGPAGIGARYRQNDQVSIGLDVAPGQGERYATVFDLASDGTVQRLFPTGDGDDAGRLPAGSSLPVLTARITPPFGADHVVALVTPTVPNELRDLLRTVDKQQAAGRLPGAIRRALASGGAAASLSMASLYTAAQ